MKSIIITSYTITDFLVFRLSLVDVGNKYLLNSSKGGSRRTFLERKFFKTSRLRCVYLSIIPTQIQKHYFGLFLHFFFTANFDVLVVCTYLQIA